MPKFRINIGNWHQYMADASLEEPNDIRQLEGWVQTSTASVAFGVIATTSTNVASRYVLQIDAATTGTATCYYGHAAGTSPFFLKASNTKGYTIEAKVKVVDAGSSGGQCIHFMDDVYREHLLFNDGNIKLGLRETTYPMDTTTDYHRYRITVKDAECKIYVDDALKMTGLLATTSLGINDMMINFGDYFPTNNWGGEARWAYIRYSTEGAYPPNGHISDGWIYSDFDIAESRRSTKYQIIRSDNNIIPENKLQPAKIKISGTIAGTCWPSFKDAVRRLKRLLNSGTLRITIDNDRFVKGLHNNFTFKPITQTFGEYDIGFDCRYPFWQEEWATYFSTTPVVNATFYVLNSGDVTVPCKIIVTGAAAGTINDNMMLENLTQNETGKFTGVIQQTQELTIDKGFDLYNVYSVKLGTGVVINSYQGDLFTLQPGENRFVYKGLAAGTVEIYWREAFHL